MEEVEPSAESTDLIDEVKEEITNEGEEMFLYCNFNSMIKKL